MFDSRHWRKHIVNFLILYTIHDACCVYAARNKPSLLAADVLLLRYQGSICASVIPSTPSRYVSSLALHALYYTAQVIFFVFLLFFFFYFSDKWGKGTCPILVLNTWNENMAQALIVKFIDEFMSGRSREWGLEGEQTDSRSENLRWTSNLIKRRHRFHQPNSVNSNMTVLPYFFHFLLFSEAVTYTDWSHKSGVIPRGKCYRSRINLML